MTTKREPTLADRLRRECASQSDIDAAYAELQRCSHRGELEGMLLGLVEMAKMGLAGKDIQRIAEAVEKSQIIAFEYGQLKHLGRARTGLDFLEEEAR